MLLFKDRKFNVELENFHPQKALILYLDLKVMTVLYNSCLPNNRVVTIFHNLSILPPTRSY